MQVRVCVMFKPPTEEDWRSMRSIANSLTDERKSVRVFADADPEWLVAEFTMPTESQDRAVSKIDARLRYDAGNRNDSTIAFPRTAEEQARRDRINARRRARRAAKRKNDS